MEYFSQKGMEAALQQLADKICSNERGSFNAMLAPQLVSADYENRSCTLCFTPEDWMSNPAGVVHGGILCSAADLAMGFLSLYFARDTVSGITPTVNMSINYLRPVPMSGPFYLTAAIGHAGRRLNQTDCTIYLPGTPEKPCVTAVGTYFIPEGK